VNNLFLNVNVSTRFKEKLHDADITVGVIKHAAEMRSNRKRGVTVLQ
jgi:hypothetical protein